MRCGGGRALGAAGAFTALSLLSCLYVFRSGMWGGSLLAPVDLAPALFDSYRQVDPNGARVPANHYIVDQLLYDLPLQTTVYRAVRAGEVPWWDPYTYAGRPLLADAHVNGTDVVRQLCYRLLPFELAYNWTKVLHSVFAGVFAYLMLRYFGFAFSTAALLGLAWQFCGAHVMLFGHPWLQASILYYPLLWMVWDGAVQRVTAARMVGASLLCALIFNSGNLQSHAYLFVFATALSIGYGRFEREAWWRTAKVVLPSIMLGALLVSPLLANQVEFLTESVREIRADAPRGWLRGVLSLSAIYPWALGTFRTLDVGKLAGESGLGFYLSVGPGAILLALVAARASDVERAGWSPVRRSAVAMLVLYWVVISTPLAAFLYVRWAALPALGLVLLAADALEHLQGRGAGQLSRWARLIGAGTAVTGVATNAFAFVVFPRLHDKVLSLVAARAESGRVSGHVEALRSAQVARLPDEISWLNPETVFASAALVALVAMLCSRRLQASRWARGGLLVLNLLPLLHFAHRFTPVHPVALWHRLVLGGPGHENARSVLSGVGAGRLDDSAEAGRQLYPAAMAHLNQISTVHGYSALIPRTFASLPPTERSDWLPRVAEWRWDGVGLARRDAQRSGRFAWEGPAREVDLELIGLNGAGVRFGPGAGGRFVWYATRYPGWRAAIDGVPTDLVPASPAHSTVDVPAGARELVLTYEPRWLRATLGLSAAAWLFLAVWALWRSSRGAPTGQGR